jgi:hypothetical protein
MWVLATLHARALHTPVFLGLLSTKQDAAHPFPLAVAALLILSSLRFF